MNMILERERERVSHQLGNTRELNMTRRHVGMSPLPRKYDADGDGVLSEEEMLVVFQQINPKLAQNPGSRLGAWLSNLLRQKTSWIM